MLKQIGALSKQPGNGVFVGFSLHRYNAADNGHWQQYDDQDWPG